MLLLASPETGGIPQGGRGNFAALERSCLPMARLACYTRPMKMVVVGGNSRDIGKTSVVAGIIHALPHYNWTAVKLTQYGHGICSEDGEECDCAPEDHSFAITEETDRSGQTDTSRFLVAGARRALWVRVRMGMLETALPDLRRAIGDAPHVILESNSILRFVHPNLYLALLDPLKKDFKDSAREFLARADAYLILEPGLEDSIWEGIPLELLRTKPIFPLRRDYLIPPEITPFLDARLRAKECTLPLC
ncbi:MAG: hypothetical protein HY647_02920 [Acidobacteria bacterium]|nr:hypothetical protein [Acidobacteriota bacterium]